MPRDAAESIFDGLVELMMSTILALFVLSLLVAVIAWFSGPWRPARAARNLAGSGFARVLDGRIVEHWGLVDELGLLQQIGADLSSIHLIARQLGPRGTAT